MQLVVGAALAGVALTIPGPSFFRWTLACFWLLAFSSATHDIAADGFYMLALTEREQAFFVGIRSTFYRVATIGGQGLLVILAGTIQQRTGNVTFAWSVAFGAWPGCSCASASITVSSCRGRAAINRGDAGSLARFFAEFVDTIAAFFRKPGIAVLAAVPAALPLRRGATGEDGVALPARRARRRAAWG